jgi:hypothetical protein
VRRESTVTLDGCEVADNDRGSWLVEDQSKLNREPDRP